MSEEEKRILEQQLWKIANELRGKMDADEFRDYILGFIFYKYLSEKMLAYANQILKQDGIDYKSIDENSAEGKEILEAILDDSLDKLGYFLKPSELFSEIAKKGNSEDAENQSNFILGDLTNILKNIEQTTMGTESEDDFGGLFEDLDLTKSKLGRTEEDKNKLISKVLSHLDKISFNLDDARSDIIGDAYEYLISQFASGAGKKAILDLVSGEAELRSKRQLIEQFINENMIDGSPSEDVEGDFTNFWNTEKRKAFEKLCQDENLITEELKKVIDNYLYTERKPLREAIVKTLQEKPKILERKSIVVRVTQKIVDFVETFINGMDA